MRRCLKELCKFRFDVRGVILCDNLRHIRSWTRYFQKMKETCRGCFLANSVAKEAQTRKKLADEVPEHYQRDSTRTCAHCQNSAACYANCCLMTEAVDDDNKNHSLSFDSTQNFRYAFPEGKLREVWFDHAIVQETCPTHSEDTLKILKRTKKIYLRTRRHSKSYGAKMRRYICTNPGCKSPHGRTQAEIPACNFYIQLFLHWAM